MSSSSQQSQAEEVAVEEEGPVYCVEEPKKRVYKSYTDYLATPNPRRYFTPLHMREKDNRVPRAALRARPTKRVQNLALPKSLPTSLHSWEIIPSVEPAALRYQITDRIKELSVPSPRKLRECLKEHDQLLTDIQKQTLGDQLKEGEKLSRRIHDKYYIRDELREPDSISLKSKTSKASKKSAKLSKKRELEHQQRIEMLAQPLLRAQKIILSRGRKIPLPKLMRRIRGLSKPISRDSGAHRAKEWKFTDEMKTYVPSERLNFISRPIMRPNIHINMDPKVSEAAKHGQATERVKVLAIPKRKAQEPDTELRENPFSVSPLALQGKCTPRLKELAMPVKRDAKR